MIGIGGSGMSGIAELLVHAGYEVSGSDLVTNEATRHLTQLGVGCWEGHAASHVGEVDVVVRSAAVDESNPEVREAHARGIPVIPRAQMLAELLEHRSGIAVAGSHGKTTTTTMVAVVLEHAGLDPAVVVGGRVDRYGGHARTGRGVWMVVEADESDGSFLRLSPRLAVVTNIDREHLDRYPDPDALDRAFLDFLHRVPPDGMAILGAGDLRVAGLAGRVERPVTTYGLDVDADVSGRDVRLDGFRTSCTVSVREPGQSTGQERGRLSLTVPGRHNLENALAAVAVAERLGVAFGTVAEALAGFEGVGRRFQVVGREGGATVVDDYGHHPTEIRAVLAAARSLNPTRVVVAFQPHRYSRTRLLLDEFAAALQDTDELLLTDIYPAGEEPVAGVTTEGLEAAIRAAGHPAVRAIGPVEGVPDQIGRVVRPGDLVVLLGAGSIGAAAPQVVADLHRRMKGDDEHRHEN